MDRVTEVQVQALTELTESGWHDHTLLIVGIKHLLTVQDLELSALRGVERAGAMPLSQLGQPFRRFFGHFDRADDQMNGMK